MEKSVLRAAKAVVQEANLVKPRSVFFTPHDTFMPSGVSCPAIGLKDGKVIRKELAGGMISLVFQVEYICWVNMSNDGEEALVGDDGIMALVESLQSTMDLNRLTLDAIQYARLIGPQPSRLFVTDNSRWLVKKTTVVEYDLEFER